MKVKTSFIALSLLAGSQLPLPASAQATFSTLILTPLTIEGLTNDNSGNLYTPGRNAGNGVSCPVWRVNIASPSLVPVGLIPAPSPTTQCSPSGLAFDRSGQLYVTEGDKIYRFTPNSTTPPTATLFATGVPGTNGVAFDKHGNLWTGDGTTGQGRVWKIPPAGGAGIEMFRVQPMSNEVNLVAGVGGVGRDARTLPPGTITVTPTSRNAANTLGSQPLVANGVQFTSTGDMLIADTARGALWRVNMNPGGNPVSDVGCDTTFTPNTLCLSNVWVAHPYIEGADGIALDEEDNVWVDANERNAVVLVSFQRKAIEVFRNPVDPGTQLRNLGPLETPTSPAVAGRRLCTANSDGNRRDNSPNTAGEINPAGPDRGKISCMDQNVKVRGARLPVR
jgi:sugar lactone lactonase YvrE